MPLNVVILRRENCVFIRFGMDLHDKLNTAVMEEKQRFIYFACRKLLSWESTQKHQMQYLEILKRA